MLGFTVPQRPHVTELDLCVSKHTGEKAKITGLILLLLASPGTAKSVERQQHSCQWLAHFPGPWERCINFWLWLYSSFQTKNKGLYSKQQFLLQLIFLFPVIIVPKGRLSSTELSEKRGLLLSLRFWRPGASYLLCKASCPSHTTSFLFFTWKTQPGEILLWGPGSAKDTDATSYQGEPGSAKLGLIHPRHLHSKSDLWQLRHLSRHIPARKKLVGHFSQVGVEVCGQLRLPAAQTPRESQVLWPQLSVQPPWQVPCNEGGAGRPRPRCWEPRLKILLKEPFLDFSCNVSEKKWGGKKRTKRELEVTALLCTKGKGNQAAGLFPFC